VAVIDHLSRVTTNVNVMRRTAECSWLHHRRHCDILELNNRPSRKEWAQN